MRFHFTSAVPPNALAFSSHTLIDQSKGGLVIFRGRSLINTFRSDGLRWLRRDVCLWPWLCENAVLNVILGL